ncbi:MAG: hypothetical protein H6959_08165 [Chromatiaceae bacterium]|nr:hypothetical protein [Chromatiaceae bacterium]MCP5422881.1 hypothetical protein [Chromatiaceae bacterium]
MSLACFVWPFLAGALLAWLLGGLLARRLRRTAAMREHAPVETDDADTPIDEREPPDAVARLQSAHAAIDELTARVAELESTRPETVEKVVEIEKPVDNPAHLARIAELEADNARIGALQLRVTELDGATRPSTPGPAADVMSAPDTVIDRRAARAAGIRIEADDDLTVVEGIGPKINELLHAAGIRSLGALAQTTPTDIRAILDAAGPAFQMANPGTWPDQAHLAAHNRWTALKALQDVLDGGVYPTASARPKPPRSSIAEAESAARVSQLELKLAELSTGRAPDVERARAAGFRVSRVAERDDFTVVEGIGPAINELIHAAGIHTFAGLARTPVDVIRHILNAGGPNVALARPDTWPAQADLAAANQWEALKAWQDVLDGGEEPS